MAELYRYLKIQTRLKNQVYTLDGKTYVHQSEWVDTEMVADGTCKHVSTICFDCAVSWANDYHVRILDTNTNRVLGVNDVPGYLNVSDLEEK